MTKILCLSGKKQSGKSTTANFLTGYLMKREGIISYFDMTEDGKLLVPSSMSDGTIQNRIFDLEANNDAVWEFLAKNVWGHIKLYSFADKLKWDVCIGVLGLTYEQCFGTDEDKNSATQLVWEDMPGVITEFDPSIEHVYEEDDSPAILSEVTAEHVLTKQANAYLKVCKGLVYHKPGVMTAREVMQYVGTGIFRKMYDNVWINATLNQIKEEEPAFAVIVDGRFPNEINRVKKVGGQCLHLTRNIAQDTHESETALDEPGFNWKKFDFIIDNQNMNINEQTQAIEKALQGEGLI